MAPGIVIVPCSMACQVLGTIVEIRHLRRTAGFVLVLVTALHGPWVRADPEVLGYPDVPEEAGGSADIGEPAVTATASEQRPDEEDSEASPSQEALAREAERARDMFLRDQKILFLKGAFEFELTIVNSVETRTNARIGNITIPERSSYATNVSLLGRYAVTNWMEVNLLVPYEFSEDNIDYVFLEPVPGLEGDNVSGVGDLQAGLRFQLHREQGVIPGISLAIDYSADTGDDNIGQGHESVGIRSTAVKTIDPVVLFGELGYEFNLESDDFDPGDSWQASFGTGFSLNDRVSYTIQYSGGSTDSDEIAGTRIPNSQLILGSLQFGLTVQVSRRVFIEPFIGVGLTADATDVSVGLGIPF